MLPLESHLKKRPKHSFVEGAPVIHRSWDQVGEVVSVFEHRSGPFCKVRFEGNENLVLIGIEWLELC